MKLKDLLELIKDQDYVEIKNAQGVHLIETGAFTVATILNDDVLNSNIVTLEATCSGEFYVELDYIMAGDTNG